MHSSAWLSSVAVSTHIHGLRCLVQALFWLCTVRDAEQGPFRRCLIQPTVLSTFTVPLSSCVQTYAATKHSCIECAGVHSSHYCVNHAMKCPPLPLVAYLPQNMALCCYLLLRSPPVPRRACGEQHSMSFPLQISGGKGRGEKERRCNRFLSAS